MLIDRAEMILVAPLWNTQHWFTEILKLLVADTIILPLTQHILSFPVEPERTHPLKKLKLCECRLSGNFSNNVEYHKNLPKSLLIYLVCGTEAYGENEQCRDEHQKNQDTKKRVAVPYRQCRFYFT